MNSEGLTVMMNLYLIPGAVLCVCYCKSLLSVWRVIVIDWSKISVHQLGKYIPMYSEISQELNNQGQMKLYIVKGR